VTYEARRVIRAALNRFGASFNFDDVIERLAVGTCEGIEQPAGHDTHSIQITGTRRPVVLPRRNTGLSDHRSRGPRWVLTNLGATITRRTEKHHQPTNENEIEFCF
jgi:hypothetical protein